MIYGLSDDFKEASTVASETLRVRRIDYLTGIELGSVGFMLGSVRRSKKGVSPIRFGVMEGGEGSLPVSEDSI